MKTFAFLITILSTVFTLAQVSDLEMGQYTLTTENDFLKFDGLFIGLNNSIILTGAVADEQLKAPGCVGTYAVTNSIMTIDVLCPQTYFFGGIVQLKADLKTINPKDLYSTYSDGASMIIKIGDESKEHYEFPFVIKYVYITKNLR